MLGTTMKAARKVTHDHSYVEKWMPTVRNLLELENQADFLRERRSWTREHQFGCCADRSNLSYSHSQKGPPAALEKP